MVTLTLCKSLKKILLEVVGRVSLEEDSGAGLKEVGVDPSGPGLQRLGECLGPIHVLHDRVAILDVIPAACSKDFFKK
jgi:hypothetical protein